MRCSKYFGLGKSSCVFGQKIMNNNKNFSDAMGMCNNSVCMLNNSHGIDTVEQSEKCFSERDKKKASLVKRFQHVGGHHSGDTIMYPTVTDGIKYSPITKQDIKMALDVLGRSDAAVPGKTTQTQPKAKTC